MSGPDNRQQPSLTTPDTLRTLKLASFARRMGKSARPHTSRLNFQNDRHDKRTPLRLSGDVALQVGADFFFDHAVICFFFFARLVEGIHHNLASALDQAVFAGVEA